MVAGVGSPTTESTAKFTPLVEEEEKGKREEEGIFISPSSPPLPSSEPQDDDDDEEVSWQSAARASLEKEQKAKNQAQRAESREPKNKTQPVKQQTTISPAPPLPRSSVSTTTEPQPSTLNPQPLETQFTREELPADFWGSEAPPASSYDDDEAFETATSTPRENGHGGKARATSKPGAKLPFDMPLFNELQSLFPGRIVRIDMKQQKQAEESEESTAQVNEAASVVESEDNEG